MKRSTIICVAVTLCFAAAPAMADFVVDIGTVAGETGFSLSNWGPIEPTTHPGTWGGLDGTIGSGGGSLDGFCRTTWGYAEGSEPYPLDPGGGAKRGASITFSSPIVSATIRHLDGGSDDSFTVTVDGNLWGSYAAVPDVAEFWTTDTFGGTAGTTLTIMATGAAGPYWNSWGQLGIDRVEAVAVPVPAAVLLGMLGLGAAGLKLRKYV